MYLNPLDQKANARKWYLANLAITKDRAMKFKKFAQVRNKAFVDKYKAEKGCKDCGIKYDPWIMDLDHLPQFKKCRGVSKIVLRAQSLNIIKIELKKCDVVCSNCHRIRTYSRMKSWRNVEFLIGR